MTVDGHIGTYPLSGDDPLVGRIAQGIDRLRRKLLELDVAGLAISGYSRRYLSGSYANELSKLNLYGYLLYLAVKDAPGDLSSTSLMDYGGGNGLMALLAREAGIGTVIYNDIYDVSTADARTLGRALDLEADHFVTGDIDDAISYIRESGVTCHAICSYDVIEHVYDIGAFLRSLPGISEGPLVAIMASGANGANPRLRRKLMTIQRQVENLDRLDETGHKERDELHAYREIRKEIIRSCDSNLPAELVEQLARRTRGLMQPDIENRVARYRATGELPDPPAHPTNTCDPLTGNWAEHLMEPAELARTLASAGMPAEVLPGYYNPHVGRKGLASMALNRLISVLGGRGLHLAPYYILRAATSR